MHILHVYKDYYPVLGGIENHIRTLAELQAEAGEKVTVLVTNPAAYPGEETLNGVHIIRLPRLFTAASTPVSLYFPGMIRRLQPDITHLHFPYPVGEASQLLAGRQRPYVITYHSDIVKQKTILQFYHPLLLQVLKRAARIIPTSRNYIETSPYLSRFTEKCIPVPLSVDAALFDNAEPLLPPGEVPTLLFVGRHRYYKGVDGLLRAMPGLDARLLIGGSGPNRAAWESLSLQLGLEEKVKFVGEVSDEDLPRLYASADIFVLPANARAEAFGKVLLEAMASGLPCVTTELGTGTSFVVQDKDTGIVVPPNDPEALKNGIKPLLNDSDLRQRMGEAGRQRVRKEFTPQKLHKRVEQIYRQVLDGSKTGI